MALNPSRTLSRWALKKRSDPGGLRLTTPARHAMWFFCDFMDHNSSINTEWREEVLIYVRISEGCELLLCNASTYD